VDDPQKQRFVENEKTFREINERTSRAASGEHLDEPLHPAICECSNDECRELVFVAPKEYANVREHQRQFLIAPGHDMPEIERRVFRGNRYWVVEKLAS
jgi:hypothetical protein